MNIHTSTICLHQAAIFKADKHQLPAQIGAESKRRCIVAADQIANVMKMCSHQDLSLLNPFIAFCLYVAARVFVQYLKSKKEDQTVRSSLIFLLKAMQALRTCNPLTESFLVQLDVDLEGSGINIPSPMEGYRFNRQRPMAENPCNTDSLKCSPLYEIRESQSLDHAAREVERVQLNADINVDSTNIAYNLRSHHNAHQRHQGIFESNSHTTDTFLADTGFDDIDMAYSSFTQIPNSNPSPQNMGGDSQSTTSHSNHPTPSSSNNVSSNTSYSPQYLHEGKLPFPTDNQRVLPQRSPRPAGAWTQEILPASSETSSIWPFNGNAPTNSSTLQTPGNNFASTNQGQSLYSTSLTPGSTGMAPGQTGMTPVATQWDNADLIEDNEWMYGDWSTGDHPAKRAHEIS